MPGICNLLIVIRIASRNATMCSIWAEYFSPIIGILFVVSLGQSIYLKMFDTVICFALSGHSQVSVSCNLVVDTVT
jgi:hypothetical protein